MSGYYVSEAERDFLAVVRQFRHIGYGRMMQIISHEWFRVGGPGALVANTAYGLLTGKKREQYEQLAKADIDALDGRY